MYDHFYLVVKGLSAQDAKETAKERKKQSIQPFFFGGGFRFLFFFCRAYKVVPINEHL